MYTLFIDTHLYDINVVLYKDGNVYLHKNIDKSMNNNSLLVPTIMKCITNIKLNEIIVVNGPGSFTGVRTGVTVAKTLSYLLNVSIKTVSYLDIMDFSLDSTENLVGFYDNSGIFVAKYINHRLTGKYEYIKKRELNSNEFSNLKTDVIIDYSKIYNLTSKLPKIDPKQVNPIYVKKISVEYD